MLATLIPFFDKDMKVCAYSLFSQKENLLLNPARQASGINDGAARVEGLDILQRIGIDTLSPGTDVFVPVGSIAVFSDIESQSEAMIGRLVLLFDNSVTNTPDYQERFRQLKQKGYKLAIRKLPVEEIENYKEILSLMDYIILDYKKVDVYKARIYFGNQYPNIRICVGNIEKQEVFDDVRVDRAFHLFEGAFYRIPVTKGQTEVEPLKVNYLELMNIVNDVDFELTKAADVIGRDTALVVSLLEMVNRIATKSEVTSIRHAAALLGQRELKKWINTVITKELCADRPNEITRVSLLRAKFLECLAPSFGMGMKASELFLMGLFSVLNIILSMPMEEALNKVNVSKDIREALLSCKGEFADIYGFMTAYENADWQEVSRMQILKNIDSDAVFKAYIEAVCWYKEMFF
ncbi:MAG: HDOD domain-containing protein [Lachnospiraceae bacterium]|jgi:c-di-GMP-related signal transduction protein|nr:HDOD domain-containing protein [Lachnospiraceae bacterium]MCI9015050.1 HDOD domain-containing protein [Lachnospiraceae bacterium]MCI9255165.1 HDOD domain-containing protein [Lachnospiraceae bacterium]